MKGPSIAMCVFGTCLVSACTREPEVVPPTPTRATTREIVGATHVTSPSRDDDLTGGAPTAIDGWLMRPEGAGPFPAVVLLHGCAGLYTKTGNELAHRDREYAERFVKEGYVALLPDSFSARGASEICSHHERTIRPAYERNRDAYGALVWLEHQPFVRADRVGLLGWSNGGITVLAAVAQKTHSRPADLAHDFRVAVAFYPDCRQTLSRQDWAPPVAPLHILIGEVDDWTPAGPCLTLVNEARANGAILDIVVYPGAYHDFDDPEMPVHVRHNVATTESGTATIGMNPAARADAIERVSRIFRDALGPQG
jgi:dienelactone hydrolase